MHGKKYDPYIPIYGNKCIGVRFSTIDIHGAPRTKTWTSLQTTIPIGATTLTLQDPVDWQVGEKFVMASTGFKKEEAEKRTVTAISPD